jgi:hypothetical protein
LKENLMFSGTNFTGLCVDDYWGPGYKCRNCQIIFNTQSRSPEFLVYIDTNSESGRSISELEPVG